MGWIFFCIFIHKISVFVCIQYLRWLPSYDKFKIGTCGKIFGNYIYMEFLNQLKVNFVGMFLSWFYKKMYILILIGKGPGWLNELGSCITSLSPIRHRFAHSFVNYKKGAHGRWFSPGTPASSTTKTGHHDIAEILLKVTLNTKNQSFY